MRLQNEICYKDENFIVGNGTIVTNNICIPLNAISIIKIEDKKKQSLRKAIITMIIGLLLCIIPVINFIGGIVLLCGIITLIKLIWENSLQKYGLVIQVHSGMSYIFEHHDLNFIRKIADVIRKGLDDTSGVTYISMGNSKIEHNYNGNPSFLSFGDNNTFGSGNIFGSGNAVGDIVMGANGSIIKKDSHDTIDSNNSEKIFSTKEWEKMERYFQIRAEELGESNEAYQSCRRMQQYANKKDAQGLRTFMRIIGKSILTIVFGKATEYGIRSLLERLTTIS